MGIRSGSPLKRGRTRTCSVPQGFSVEDVDKIDGVGTLELVRLKEEEDGPVEREGASAEGRWAKLPRRCISRETSLES